MYVAEVKKNEILASPGEWQLVARWRSNQREQDLAALRLAYEAAQAPSVTTAALMSSHPQLGHVDGTAIAELAIRRV